MTAWRSLLTALRHPATAAVVPRLGRRVLLEPGIFDLVSCFMQLRDGRAVAKIREDLPRDTFYAKVADYNAGVTERKVITTTRRAEIYYQTLALPPRDTSVETLLIVGPRNVHELLIAWLYGYRWKNIQAIDLYSTNPKIRVMNMEAMTFPDESFDAVVMSNTLAYAQDTFQCLSEVARVLKPGGRFVFGATYFPQSVDWPGNRVSGNDIRQMLRKLSLAIVFYSAFDKVNSLGGLQTAHIFSAQKLDPRSPGFDRVDW
jgi:SAM-dependent methyltransferase